ncbi:unnamed protein product [Darwinula stevensoni]|uniref:NR LBD domain-containing protein n=1 Tax=Darwinula stevensoni TaxID=69355 RepID=A0A7R9FTB9_9CRUS|nr:unnamed protein product [Darwinula stevensoni]CAG0904949.1 unnamed protein product [Darwinula stevensoni]
MPLDSKCKAGRLSFSSGPQIPFRQRMDNLVKLEVLKSAGGNLYEEHHRFITSFEREWRNDENIMLLLGAVSLFSPHRANVRHHDVIQLEQESYLYLLRRYLETKLVGCEARSQYLGLIRRMQDLRILNEKHVRVFLEVNPREVEPLLIEIFDLKHT